MRFRPLPTRRQALLTCIWVALVAVGGAGLVIAAALVPAPPAVLPVLALACIACTALATLELPISLAVLRGPRLDVQALRRHLDSLPETDHPLGL
jgi:hypothetical protein